MATMAPVTRPHSSTTLCCILPVFSSFSLSLSLFSRSHGTGDGTCSDGSGGVVNSSGGVGGGGQRQLFGGEAGDRERREEEGGVRKVLGAIGRRGLPRAEAGAGVGDAGVWARVGRRDDVGGARVVWWGGVPHWSPERRHPVPVHSRRLREPRLLRPLHCCRFQRRRLRHPFQRRLPVPLLPLSRPLPGRRHQDLPLRLY